MRKIFLLATTIVFCACSSSKNTEDQWVGKTKQSLIKSWGTPVRTFDNNSEGDILVYADQIYDESNKNDSREAGSSYWNHIYFYVDKSGKVSSFRREKQNYPPQVIDSNKLIDTKLLTVK